MCIWKYQSEAFQQDAEQWLGGVLHNSRNREILFVAENPASVPAVGCAARGLSMIIFPFRKVSSLLWAADIK